MKAQGFFNKLKLVIELDVDIFVYKYSTII